MATKQAKYPIEVFWSEEDAGYIAIVPDLPGCSAWGASEADAIKETHDAIAAWLKAAKSAGHVIPEPMPPLDEAGFSGKFLMRLPRRLHADLARKAKREGVSLNQYVLYLLSERNSQRAATVESYRIGAKPHSATPSGSRSAS